MNIITTQFCPGLDPPLLSLSNILKHKQRNSIFFWIITFQVCHFYFMQGTWSKMKHYGTFWSDIFMFIAIQKTNSSSVDSHHTFALSKNLLIRFRWACQLCGRDATKSLPIFVPWNGQLLLAWVSTRLLADLCTLHRFPEIVFAWIQKSTSVITLSGLQLVHR